jgi:hypothetical protein
MSVPLLDYPEDGIIMFIARCIVIHEVSFLKKTKVLNRKLFYTFFCGSATQRGSCPLHSRGFLDYTPRRTTVGRTPLDE